MAETNYNKEKSNMSKANCNWWQYSRQVYNIGRTCKYLPYSEIETANIKSFISSILTSRPGISPRVNQKYWNAGESLNDQNPFALGSILQIIGRNLKQDAPTDAEKTLCDSLFAVTGNRKNKVVSQYVSISGTVSPASSGTISGLGSYAKSSTATLKAVKSRGYVFSKWEDDSTAATRTISNIQADKAVTATFVTDTARTITASPAVAETGSVAISGATSPYYDGDELTLTPTAAEGYTFQKWEDDSTTAVRKVIVNGNKTYTATFIAG